MIGLWAAIGCGVRHLPHYEPVGLALAPTDPEFTEALPALIARDLARGRLRSLAATPTGDPGDAAPVSDPGALAPEVLYAVYSCRRRWARGAELDLLVDAGAGPRPVTLWIGPRWDVVVGSGEAPPDRVPRPAGVPWTAWADRLAARHGLVGFRSEGRTWTEQEVGDVVTALSRLRPEESAVLAGIELVRKPTSPRAPGRELAWFDPNAPVPRIEFFDLAFADDRIGFVGPVRAPIAAGAMTALHEFGHLVADAPLRAAYQGYLAHFERGEDAAARAQYRAYRRLGSRGPVIEAWEEVRAGRPGPSTYGARSPHESFAEAFALYHLDPDALERALPGAAAWFSAGGHLAAAGLIGAGALSSPP